MNCSETTNAWDAINNVKVVPFRAENGVVFPENILGPEADENLLKIMESLDKGKGSETEGETELSLRNDSEVPNHSAQCRKIRTEDNQAFAENAILAAQNELNALLDQLEPKRPCIELKTLRLEHNIVQFSGEVLSRSGNCYDNSYVVMWSRSLVRSRQNCVVPLKAGWEA